MPVFSKRSVLLWMNSLQDFKKSVRRHTDFLKIFLEYSLNSTAFNDDGALVEDVTQGFVNSTALVKWVGTAIDLLDKAAL